MDRQMDRLQASPFTVCTNNAQFAALGSVVIRSMIVPHLFAAGALHIVQIRSCEVAHLVASQGRRLACFRCVFCGRDSS
jgi:hypothetical protein